LAAAFCLLASWTAFGETVQYTIDPSNSSLRLSGTCAGKSIGNQSVVVLGDGYGIGCGGGDGPSLNALWSGIIMAERDVVQNTLQFTGGSMAAQETGLYAGLSAGPQCGQYGFYASTYSLPGTSWMGAIRDFQMALSSPMISSPAQFNSNILSANVLAGHVDYSADSYTHTVPIYHYPTQYGTPPLPGTMTLASATASLTTLADNETLTIPIQTQFTVMMGSTPLTLELSGNLVATRSLSSVSVPEPASVGILGMVSFALIGRRRKR
jgi:hypothetical protein